MSAVGCGAARAPAGAEPLLPPGAGVFTGLTGGSYSAFTGEVGKHPGSTGCSRPGAGPSNRPSRFLAYAPEWLGH
jgi:hypothetical protein